MALEYANEVWKDCKGYEGLYQVSNYGRVWNVKTQRYLGGTVNNHGYKIITVTAKNGKRKKESVHRLVALAFIDNPENLPFVNHKDENKTNNNVENLEWCSAEYNINYSRGKAIYCVELQKEFESSQVAMRDLGIDGSAIRKCCKGLANTAGGYHWRYVD